MSSSRMLISFIAAWLSFLLITRAEHTDALDKIEPGDYNLPDNYKDLYRITSKNFDARVINSEETWIVIISPTGFEFDYNWKKEAKQFRGTCFFGVVDAREEPKFALQVYFQASGSHDWNGKEVAGVFKGKHVKPELAKNPWKAMRVATRVNKVGGLKHFSPAKEDEMYNYVVPAFYHSQPYARFPVIMVYDDDGPIPLVQRIIGNDRLFQMYFDFRVMKSSEFEHLKLLFPDVPKPENFPHYLGLIGKEPASGDSELTFDVVSFVEKKFKQPKSYKAVSEYLFWMHKEYRNVLPGRKPSEAPELLIEPLAKAIRQRLNAVLKPRVKASKDEL